MMIWVTELGDKTFFIAAILAMRFDRMIIFTGALGALAVMTVLSAVMVSLKKFDFDKIHSHIVATFLTYRVTLCQTSCLASMPTIWQPVFSCTSVFYSSR